MTQVSNAASNITEWNLIPLTPEYLENEHRCYVAALESALKDDRVRNIALSGNYGVGKSSILRELGRRLDNRVVELSLSTLAPIETERLDDSVPIQATTPTNRIQQEIVKQLLYRERPSRTPASRFRRIERFRLGKEICVAALVGFVAVLIFLLAGWTAQLATGFATLRTIGGWVHLIIWSVVTAAVLMVRRLSYGAIRVKQLSAGAATVTLDDNSVSFFDQYLDEIVYFFEVSARDVVIFEDIDRFDDSHIFETLRALNTLLNASPQIKSPIRFIYAIKDSIFDHVGLEAAARESEASALDSWDSAHAEAVRANRTKFFDLVIPVVPFITHRNARNLAVQLLTGIEHRVAPELLDLAAQYVPDMRLLKNARNEFIVFRDRIFSGDGEHLDLNETDLFAMMLYKSTHLTDFERIRLGASNLDALYSFSRELVRDNTRRIERERRELRDELDRVNGLDARSAELGERLVSLIECAVEALGYSVSTREVTFKGSTYSFDDIKSADFWKAFFAANGDPVVKWPGYYAMDFARSRIVEVLGIPPDVDIWTKSDQKSLTAKIQQKGEDIEVLRRADFGDLLKRPKYREGQDASGLSFAERAEGLLKRGLGYELVQAGYLNRSFALYTSIFHGDRLSSAATNFIIHHVERREMDEYFELAAADVDDVVRECGTASLKESAFYNVAILDRLLDTDIEAADIMVRSLAVLGDIQTRFLQAYLVSGRQRIRFILRFVAVSEGILGHLVSRLELDENSRAEMVNTVLANLPASGQRVDDAVIEYLRVNYDKFPVLTDEATSIQTERVGELYAGAHIRLRSLAPLSGAARQSFVSRSLYYVTCENLAVAIGGDGAVALDDVLDADTSVYEHVLNNLDDYLEAIDGRSVSVAGPARFIAVLENLLERKSSRLGDVIERAAPDCKVADLRTVGRAAWSSLASNRRFPPTFTNVSAYVSALGVDEPLALLLADTGAITDVASAAEDEKETLALAILASQDRIPDATLRVSLVVSLELSGFLDATDVAAETGELFASLLRQRVISDTAESYERLAVTDWPTRKAFICASKEFVNYMTPALLRPDLSALMADAEIPQAVAREIIEHSDVYFEDAGEQELHILARVAVQNGYVVPCSVILRMAQRGVSERYVVVLLEPHLDSLEWVRLAEILQALGGVPRDLTAVGAQVLRVVDTPAHWSLLNCLIGHGIVSSFKRSGARLLVYRKRK